MGTSSGKLVRFAEPIILRAPDDDDDNQDDQDEGQKPKFVTHDDLTKALTRRDRKIINGMKGDLKEILADSGFLTVEQLQEQVEKLLKDDLSEGGGDGDDKDKGGGGDVPAGLQAQMSRMERELKELQKKNLELSEKAQEKDKQLETDRRNAMIDKLLSEAGAVDPEEVRKAHLESKLVNDEELGWAVPVKLDTGGQDLVPVKDYVPTLKDERSHLFSKSQKSGSGAGSGDEGRTKPKVTAEKLRDPKDGGMGWEDYEKQRETIHSDLESSR